MRITKEMILAGADENRRYDRRRYGAQGVTGDPTYPYEKVSERILNAAMRQDRKSRRGK
jgi:hypothetical protein